MPETKNHNIKIKNFNASVFEDIKRVDPDGMEYWSSRDLSKALECSDYRNFEFGRR